MFNLDLLAAAALACVSSAGGAVALMLAWAADGIRAAAKNYHFMSTFDFVDAVRFIDMLNLRAIVSLSLLATAAGLLVGLALVLRLTHHSRQFVLPLLAVALLAVAGDVANGSFHPLGLDKDSRGVSLNFAGSPAWNVWATERRSLPASGTASAIADPVTFRTLRTWQTAHPKQTSMLILVESMGQPRDPTLRYWLNARLMTTRLAARWDVSQAEELFMGSTTFGELRALCGLHVHYSQIDKALAAGCLPHLLATDGVRSIGIHGFGLRMFDRGIWWPRIGLHPWKWQDVGTATSMNCNPAFPGVCDSDVLAEAMRQAQAPGRFVYALTLDTHLPLDLNRLPKMPLDLQAACVASSTALEACQLIHQLGDLLSRLEATLAASGATPFLVVAGDHAPPFRETSNRKAFEADRVPMFVLRPR